MEHAVRRFSSLVRCKQELHAGPMEVPRYLTINPSFCSDASKLLIS